MSINADKILALKTDKTVYKDRDTVLKVFDRNYSKSDIIYEALNQSVVEEAGLSVPKVLEITQMDGKWSIRSEFIPGKTLERLMQENPEKQDEYLEQFVDIQQSIHEKETRLLSSMKDEMNRIILGSDLDATVRYELHTRLAGMSNLNKICHGEFYPTNIIIRDDGTPFILDWGHASKGNASADAAQTFLLLQKEGKAELAEKYLELFTEKSGIDPKYAQMWIPIVAASTAAEETAANRAFLMQWVDFLKY